ncbi:hypothetical protein J2T09_003235 [Neorhizobium huautlense]|uniref:DUF2059 domain-containing protein n=1 Tax=Neorhizobium huautlense TaxID=67774 RepID=A0ABT9PVH8_9HYPH|nr:DUF2059 domain-containing protein [Neorhizobium huautlense]MDP9838467.1 hypothetical protein [Neorhizobium huautlense]
MIRLAVFGRAAALATLVSGLALGGAAQAQEISASHLQAARDVITSIQATERFDNILPNLAERLKAEFILSSPNFQDKISETVDAEAIALAPRRADLEKEAATAYAKAFTEDELKQIAAFHSSAAGKKFLSTLPLVQRELGRAAEIWANGVSRDLTSQSTAKLRDVVAVAPSQPSGAEAVNPAPTQP